MPTFYKPGTRRKNRHWIARGRIEGREYEPSFPKARNKTTCREAWDEFKRDIREGNHSRTAPTFSNAVNHYEKTGRRSIAQMGWARIVEKELGPMLLDSIRPGHIKEAARKLYPGRKASTLNRHALQVASAVINNAADDDWCHHIRVKAFKEDEPVKSQPSLGAGVALLTASEGYQRLYIAALHYQGLRPSDTLSMSWDGIDMNGKTFQVLIPKSKKVVKIAMDESFHECLSEIPENERTGKVFPWLNRSGVYNWLNPLIKKVGVDFGARKARHLFASDIANSGGSSWDIVNAGSWTSEQSTKPYVTLQEDRAREVLRNRFAGQKSGVKRASG